MPRNPMQPFIIRTLDVAARRRFWVLLVLGWLASILVAGAVGMAISSNTVDASHGSETKVLKRENENLKAELAVSRRAEQVAKVAVEEVQRTVRDRQEEIAGLRADLAFYSRLVGGGRGEGLLVQGIKLSPVAGSRAWNFSATLTQSMTREQEIAGRLTLSVDGVRAGKLQTLNWETLLQKDSDNGVDYSFKYFQQVRGTIMLPEGFSPNRLHVQAEGDGRRAERDFDWKEAQTNEEPADVG
ncbi:MAG: DUF6776 family protein [Dokdonella sp.]